MIHSSIGQNLPSAECYNAALILTPQVFKPMIAVYSRAEPASHRTGKKQDYTK